MASNVLNILTLFTLFISVLFFILAPFLIKLVVPGFSPEKTALTLELTRILFLSPILL